MEITKKLFGPITLGALHLKNAFIMAPLTRQRANPADGIPTDMMVEYYTMRASFGMIITECSPISKISAYFPGAPGIYSKEQVQGWKKVVDSVHAKGGLIIMQIWHSGRVVLQDQIPGEHAISSTDRGITVTNHFSQVEECAIPQRLTKEGIQRVIEEFRLGAVNAKKAGFDGLELHAANGYLVDQFLRDSANDRTDEYGGSIENRSRFCLEVMDALVSVFGPDRVGIRLSPTGRINGMSDSNPLKLLEYLLPQLEKRGLAFVEVKRHGKSIREKSNAADQIPTETFFHAVRKFYKGKLIANDGVTIDEMKALISENIADAVAFGHLAMSNPDLSERVRNNWKIDESVDKSTWYSPGPKGYLDYLPYQQEQDKQQS